MPQLSTDSGTHRPLFLSKIFPITHIHSSSLSEASNLTQLSTHLYHPPIHKATIGTEDAILSTSFLLPGLYLQPWGFFSACLGILQGHDPRLCLPWELLSQSSQGACDSQNSMCISCLDLRRKIYVCHVERGSPMQGHCLQIHQYSY